MNKRALGRGLSTLLPKRAAEEPDATSSPVTVPQQAAGHGVAPAPLPQTLPTDAIVPNPFQPRKLFDEATLHELAQSIRTDGVIQPLVVRKSGEQYQLIAGERRWRASRIAGLSVVPVHIQEMPDDRMLEVALVENIQRENLNAIEEAEAFARLSEDLGFSHEEIGQRTGKDRATVSNAIRLLQLTPEVRQLVATHQLSAGHARALLRLNDPAQIRELARKAVENQWSVRQLETMTSVGAEGTPAPKRASETAVDPNVQAAIAELERVLGTRVRIVDRGKGKGRLEIEFYSSSDLDRIYSAIVPAG